MPVPRTDEEIEARAAELDCAPLLVPVIERLDQMLELLKQWSDQKIAHAEFTKIRNSLSSTNDE